MTIIVHIGLRRNNNKERGRRGGSSNLELERMEPTRIMISDRCGKIF